MSLDVYLILKGAQVQRQSTGIFVRQNGATVELTEQQWREQNPDTEPVRYCNNEPTDEVYAANITHNLTTMADHAGIYQELWRPEEIGITKASQLVKPLWEGLTILRNDPDKFKSYNPPNGWGTYEGLMDFVEQYLVACIKHPDATIEVSR